MTETPDGPSPEDDEGPDWEAAINDMVADALRRADKMHDEELRRYEREEEQLGPDELLDTFEGDALIDSIAQGVRGDLGPDELTELLAGLRDRPDDHDIPVPNTARTERGENVLPPPAPSTPGGTPAMTAMEDAQQIRNLGEAAKNRALSALNAIEAKLDELVNAIQGAASGPGEFAQTAANILGADHPGAAQLNGAVAGWADALAPLVERVTAMRETAVTAAGGAGQLQQEFDAVAATLSGGGAG